MSATGPTRGDASTGFEFQGLDELSQRFDDAVVMAHVDDTTTAVQETLTDMLSHGRVKLPADVLRPVPGKYARRLLYRSAEHGYVVIAMIWGPDQGTALHD
ncbi:MAG: cysteine dioxygenase, partial [Acidobacteriota bacterium]